MLGKVKRLLRRRPRPNTAPPAVAPVEKARAPVVLGEAPRNAYRAESRDKYIWYLQKFVESQQRVADHIKSHAAGLTGTAKKQALANAAAAQNLARRTKRERDALRGVWTAWPMMVGPGNALQYAPNVRRTIDDLGRKYRNTGMVKRSNAKARATNAAFWNAFNAPPPNARPNNKRRGPVPLRNVRW